MVDILHHAGRTAGTARYLARDALVRSRLRPYRPVHWSAREWHTAYGGSSYLGSGDEQPRYSVLVGYLELVGRDARILDLGCGSGRLRARISHIPFAQYVGVDGSALAVEQARQRVTSDGRTEFRLGDVRIDGGEAADVVVCSEVLYYIDDPSRFVTRLHDWLHPGGHLLTSMSRHPGDAVLWRVIDRTFGRVSATDVRTIGHPVAPRGWRVMLHRRR